MNEGLEFIIPAYGQSAHLDECINSLLSQTLKCRIKICTSTPSQYLSSLANKYNIPLLVNPVRDSIATDWNFALNSGESRYIVLAHQDDIYDSRFAEMGINFFKKFPDVGIVFTDSVELIGNKSYKFTMREVVKKTIRLFAFQFREYIFRSSQLFRLFAFGCPIPCPSVIFNSKIVGGQQFSGHFTVNLDWDLWSRIGAAGLKIGYIRHANLIHRIHKDAETQLAIKEFRRHNEDILIFERYWPPYVAKIIHFFYKLGY